MKAITVALLCTLATGCGGTDAEMNLAEDEVGTSEDALFGKKSCEANFTIDEIHFTGFLDLGEVKGLSKKVKCRKLAVAEGPSLLRPLLLQAGFRDKAARPDSKPRLNDGATFQCGQTIQMYADTRVEGKRKSRDAAFPVEIDCEGLGIAPVLD